jgi:fatty acid desaturase
MSWRGSLVCVLVILAGVLAVAFFGFGVAPWLVLLGAFCVLMMGSMIWMMFAMGKNAMHRH